MYIVSVPNFAKYDASVAILKADEMSDELKFIAIDEERLLRVKHTYSFPFLSLNYCSEALGLDDISKADLLVTDYARRKSIYNDGPGYRKLENDYAKGIMKIPKERISIVNHHLAHAAVAFYPSRFEEAAVLVVDGMGSDLETQSLFYAKGNEFKLLDKGCYWGPGALYARVTGRILGFVGLNGVSLSGKTMGLAPYGLNINKNILDIRAKYDGLNSDYSYFISRFPKPEIKQKNLVSCTNPEDVTNEYYTQIAYDVQEEAEKAMIHFANHAYKMTKCKRLCISGGVALNSVANGKIIEHTPFEEVYVTPACSDTGITLGLALYGYYNILKPSKPKRFFMPTAYTGGEYASADIKVLLERFGITYHQRDIKLVAEELVRKKIVGWLVGKSEIGPRALGHRSIIADPRNPEMKDMLNRRVKHREGFRPFAPAILEEHVSEYFPITHKTPFMLEVYPIREEMRDKIPSVVHVDGTGRLQTVSRDESPEYYELISCFYELTGIPVILNTSFNDKEPIVETPVDALITFLSTAIDILVLENFMIYKTEIPSEQAIQTARILTQERTKGIECGIRKAKEKFFNNYSDEACKRFLKEEELIAQWHLKYRAKYELEKFIDTQKNNSGGIVIYGTKKHTKILYERIYDFPLLRVVGFIEYPGHKHEDVEFSVFKEIKEEDLSSTAYDWIIVSSHEYQFDILDRLDILQAPQNKRVILYDNAADSLIKHLDYLPVYNPVI